MIKLIIALKYAYSKIKGQRTVGIFILLGITFGMLALIVSGSIMNGLQNNQIDILKNLESFDIIVQNSDLTADDLKNSINEIRVYSFAESPVLITDTKSSKSLAARIRAYDAEFLQYLKNLNYLNFTDGTLKNGLLLSGNIRYSLNSDQNNEIEITVLKPGKTVSLVPYTFETAVDSFYYSALSDFNTSTVIMDINTYKNLIGEKNINSGIICKTNVEKVAKKIQQLDPKAKIITWKEYHSGVYSALVIEKAMMYLFLGLIFLIICINLKNSTHRLLNLKKGECAILKAFGYNNKDLLQIILLQGLVIVLPGEITGIILSVIFINNIQGILNLADSLIYLISGSPTILSSAAFNATISFFEIFIMFATVLLLAVLFTYRGCKKLLKKNVTEILADVSA